MTLDCTVLALYKDKVKRHELLTTVIQEDLSLVQIKERIVTSANVNSAEAPVSAFKTRFESAYRRVKKSKVWDSPKKQKTLEKLLETLEQLAETD